MPHLPIWLHVVIFAVATAVIWFAGTRLERAVAGIEKRTRIGEAFAGVVLLAIATSLPEVATTFTAVFLLENPSLAVHNLLGGVALQTAMIAIADAVKRDRGALTAARPEFSLVLQGVGLLLLLVLIIAGISADGRPVVWAVSPWLVVVGVVYFGIVYLTYAQRNAPRWQPVEDGGSGAAHEHRADTRDDEGGEDGPSLTRIWVQFAICSVFVLLGGWAAATSADAMAEASGLGPAFLGATLLALATSVPELSTTLSASRRGRYTTVVSNVFGSNSFDVALLLLADLLSRQGSVLASAGDTLLYVAALGAVMTCIYLVGLLERFDRTVLGIGWDSAFALGAYGGGVTILYFMR